MARRASAAAPSWSPSSSSESARWSGWHRLARVRRGEAAQLRERLLHLAVLEERRGRALERDPVRLSAGGGAHSRRERVRLRRGEPPTARVEEVRRGDRAVLSGRVAPRERRRTEALHRALGEPPCPEPIGREDAVADLPAVGEGELQVVAARGGRGALALAAEECGERLEHRRGADGDERLVVAGLGERAPLRLDPDPERRGRVLEAAHVRAEEHVGAERLARVPLVQAIAVIEGNSRAELALARREQASELTRLDDAGRGRARRGGARGR